MGSNTGTVMTLINSIIGVSVLAMPFCFKQCGIILSVIMLIASSFLSRLSCHFLLKAAQMARRTKFEYLAFHTFGQTGKFFVGLSVIGFLLGTCIAFFVVIGDLGPVIVSKTVGVNHSSALRPSILLGLALFVVLPLGLLRNVSSLNSISTATVGFYVCLVVKVIGEAMPHLLAGNWLDNVYFWKPEGILQCIPIFSMALFCQTQLFEISESLSNPSLEHMNNLIRNAVNICTCVYICVGFFGYVAFCTQNFTGNVLMSFSPSIFSDAIKLGFVLSLGVSFPLVIFPCRACLYSLFFRKVQLSHHEVINAHIPEARFKCITIFVIGLSLAVGLLVPNIEVVLGLVGSTIGVIICVIFPAIAFIKISTKPTAERLFAQVVLFVGLLILILGTYATLYAANESAQENVVIVAKNDLVSVPPNIPISQIQTAVNIKEEVLKDNVNQNVKSKDILDAVKIQNEETKENIKDTNKIEQKLVDVRQEPPVPVEPGALPQIVSPLPPADIPQNQKVKSDNSEENKKEIDKQDKVNRKDTVEHVINQDAIKKEEEELAEAEKQDKEQDENRNEELLQKLEKHKQEQKMLLQEQKQILEALKEHKKEFDREKEHVEKVKQVVEPNKLDVPMNIKSLNANINSPSVAQNDIPNPHPVDNNVNSVINDKTSDKKIQEALEKENNDKKIMNEADNKKEGKVADNIPPPVQGLNVPNDIPLQANQPKENVAALSHNMVPLPVAVMNESRFSKIFKQVSEDRKNEGDNIIDDGKHTFSYGEEKKAALASKEIDDAKKSVENKIDMHVNKQRDILSDNMQPIGNHDRQKRDVENVGSIEDRTVNNSSFVDKTVKDEACLKKEKDENDDGMKNISTVEIQAGEQILELQSEIQMSNKNTISKDILKHIVEIKSKIDTDMNSVQNSPKENLLHSDIIPMPLEEIQIQSKEPVKTQENVNSQIKMVPQLSLPELIPDLNIPQVAENDLNHVDTKPLSRDLKSVDVSKSEDINKDSEEGES